MKIPKPIAAILLAAILALAIAWPALLEVAL